MPEENEDKGQQTKFFDENENNLATITSSIGNDNCVVVLGPLFGINETEEEIHKEMRRLLQQGGGVQLDDEYQNLFIIEHKENTIDETVFEEMIVRSYDRIKPNNIYKTLAKIKFNALVTFTQDTFLLKAFDNLKFKYQFTYFAICGTQKEFEKLEPEAGKKIPYIYNVFGHYQHKDSLIYNYDKFYKFLFSLLGESKAFPDELVKRFSNARVFLFMGFDLKKWYVPLFITKFCKLGRENKTANPLIIATINNTERNEEYIRWLTRYPLKLQKIENTYKFINDLTSLNDPSIIRMEDANFIPSAGDGPGLTLSQKRAYLGRIGEINEDKELKDIIDDLRAIYQSKNEVETDKILINLKAHLNKCIFKIEAQSISDENYNVEVNRIRDKIMDIINR